MALCRFRQVPVYYVWPQTFGPILTVITKPVYEDNSVRFCLESLTDGQPRWFASYSMGQEFEEFVCDKAGCYRIEVSNVEIFPPTILQNFACLGAE